MASNGSTTLEKPAAGLISLDMNEQAGPLLFPPYRMEFVIEGTAPILFHRYDCEDVEDKGKSARGGQKKKTDNVESYYYRDDKGRVCLPGMGVHGALINSGRWDQDPRSSRKTAMDLVKAGIIIEEALIPCTRDGKDIKTAEFLDKRRAQVNRAAIARVRPALMPGWQAKFEVLVLESEMLNPQWVRELMNRAGRLVGLCDFRPQFGRFQVCGARVIEV